MKKVLLLGIIFLNFYCESNSEGSKNQNLTQQTTTSLSDSLEYRLIEIGKDKFDQLKSSYTNLVSKESSPVSKSNTNFLTINLESGKNLKFNLDKKNEELHHEYGGYIPGTKYVFVIANYYEGSNCFMINSQTGKTDTLWTLPYISNDKSTMVCKSLEYGLEGVPNGIQIFKQESGGYRKKLQINQEKWVPINVCLSSDNKIYIKTQGIEDFLRKKDAFKYFEVQIK